MTKRITGEYHKLGELNAFIPHALPPREPEFIFSKKITEIYGQAMNAIGQLNEIADRLLNKERFIKAYLIKESVLSSAIEGINTTIAEIFTQEISHNKSNISKQTQLVLNYNKALDLTLDLIREQNFPITSRTLLHAHAMLLSGGEGEKSNPGQYRKQQVCVGQFIPPTSDKIENLIADLEKYINTDASLPPLIKAGLAHVQFETIHPFLDGNGRIGRLLIVLMLIDSKVLTSPVLYPSVYFKKYHSEYYIRLDAVRTAGDFEGWIEFYLNCVYQSAADGYTRAKEIESLEQEIKEQITEDKELANNKKPYYKALNILFQMPIISVTDLKEKLEVSYNTANKIMQIFVKLQILTESENKQRNKLYSFSKYLALLDKELDLL